MRNPHLGPWHKSLGAPLIAAIAGLIDPVRRLARRLFHLARHRLAKAYSASASHSDLGAALCRWLRTSSRRYHRSFR
jgi:hypothetical protein